MELRELSNEEFKEFTDTYPVSSMYQTVEYGLSMINQGYEPLFLGLVDSYNKIHAASLILIQKLGQFKYAYAPRGYLIDYTATELLEEFTINIKKYLKQHKIMAIKICPLVPKAKYSPSFKLTIENPTYDTIFSELKTLKYYHLGFNNFFEALKPRFVAVTTLEENIDAMFGKLDSDFKEKISICDKAGVRIYKGNESNLQFVYDQLREKKKNSMQYVKDLYDNFSKEKKADVFLAQLETKVYLVNTQIEYQKQINICNEITDELFKNQGKADETLVNKKIEADNKLASLKSQLVYATNLLRDNPNGIIIACAMVIKHRNTVYLTLDNYNLQYKNFNPKALLIWKIMEKYAKEGYTELNLGGVTNPNFEGENKFKDINEFKFNFNASCIEYAGDFELITNFTAFSLYRNSSPIRKLLKKNKDE